MAYMKINIVHPVYKVPEHFHVDLEIKSVATEGKDRVEVIERCVTGISW